SGIGRCGCVCHTVEQFQVAIGEVGLLDQSPAVPEKHLDLVQRGQVVDEVVPQVGPAPRQLDFEVRRDHEGLGIGLVCPAKPPRCSGYEEAISRDVQRIDAYAVI